MYSAIREAAARREAASGRGVMAGREAAASGVQRVAVSALRMWPACLALLCALAVSAPAAAQVFITNSEHMIGVERATGANIGIGGTQNRLILAQPFTIPAGDSVNIREVAIYLGNLPGGSVPSTGSRVEVAIFNARENPTCTNNPESDPDLEFRCNNLPYLPAATGGDPHILFDPSDSNRLTNYIFQFENPARISNGRNVFTAPASAAALAPGNYALFVGMATNDGHAVTTNHFGMRVGQCSSRARNPDANDPGRYLDEESNAAAAWTLHQTASTTFGGRAFEVDAASDNGGEFYSQHTGKTILIDIIGEPNRAPTGLAITGTPQSSEELTADVSALADGNGLTSSPTYSYQWTQAELDGTSKDDISGETGATYTTATADEGMQIGVEASYVDDHCYANTATATVDINDPSTGLPTISGTAQVTGTLTADHAPIMDDNGKPTAAGAYTYMWERVDPAGTNAPVPLSETTDTYTLVEADRDHRVRVTVSFTDNGGFPETQTSAPFPAAPAVVGPKPDQPATGLSVTGTHTVGETLTAETDDIMDPNGRTGASFSYTWERAPSATPQASEITDITDAADTTPATYELTAADDTNWVRVTVSFTDDDDYPETLSSTWMQVSAAPPEPPPPAPANTEATGLRITSLARLGDTLEAITTDITDDDGLGTPTYTYEWERAPDSSGAADETDIMTIPGETGETYTVVEADLGHWLRVTVEFEDANGNPETLESDWRQVEERPNTPAEGDLEITGDAQVGETLRADTDGITDADGLTQPVDYTYTWERVDAEGSNPVTVGEDSETYTLGPEDEGSRLRVAVTFQDDTGEDEGPLTSANSALVQGLDDSAQMARDRDTVEIFLNRFGAGMTTQVLESVKTRTAAPPRAPGMRATLGGYHFGGAAPAPAAGIGAGTNAAAPTAGIGAGTNAAAPTATTAATRAHPFIAVLGSVAGLGSPSVDTSGMRARSFAAMAAGRRRPAPTFDKSAAMSASHTYTDGGFGGGAWPIGPAAPGGGRPRPLVRQVPSVGKSGPGGRSTGRRSLSLPSLQSLLGASSFSFTRATAGGGLSSVWGRGDYTAFEADQGPLSVDGDMTTAQLGADWSSGPWLAGLLVVHSEAESDYQQDAEGRKGDIDASMSGVYPYLSYRFTERLSAWGTLGYGTGELTLKPQRASSIDADLDLTMGALGVRDQVLRPSAEGDLAISLRADAVFMRSGSDMVARLPEAKTNTYRVRFGAEAARSTALSGGAQLSRSIEFGVLVDGGNLTQGGGMELGGGVAYARASGLSVDMRWRGSFVEGVVDTRQWGVSGGVSYDPSPASARGLSLALGSGYGGPASGGVDELFARRITDALEAGEGETPGARLEAELGYGLSALGGRYTGIPWAGLNLAGSAPEWRLGWRFTPFTDQAPDVSTGVVFGSGDTGVRLRLDASF